MTSPFANTHLWGPEPRPRGLAPYLHDGYAERVIAEAQIVTHGPLCILDEKRIGRFIAAGRVRADDLSAGDRFVDPHRLVNVVVLHHKPAGPDHVRLRVQPEGSERWREPYTIELRSTLEVETVPA